MAFKILLTKATPRLTYDDSETSSSRVVGSLSEVKIVVDRSKASEFPKYSMIEAWDSETGEYAVRLFRTRGKPRKPRSKGKFYPDRWVGTAFGRTTK